MGPWLVGQLHISRCQTVFIPRTLHQGSFLLCGWELLQKGCTWACYPSPLNFPNRVDPGPSFRTRLSLTTRVQGPSKHSVFHLRGLNRIPLRLALGWWLSK